MRVASVNIKQHISASMITLISSSTTAGSILLSLVQLSRPRLASAYPSQSSSEIISTTWSLTHLAAAETMAKSSSSTLLALLVALLCAAAAVRAADPDPLQDYCVADLSANAPLVNGYPCKPRSQSTAADFTFTGFRKPPASDAEIVETPTGAVAVLASPVEYPGINTQGVTHARLDFAVGGVIPLHTHPRAAETIFILKGTVLTGFISDDNKLFASTLQQGDVFLFPRGLSHFQVNVGNETAISFNTLTSQSPGFLVTANQIFEPNITSAVIEKSFGIDAATVRLLRTSVPNFGA